VRQLPINGSLGPSLCGHFGPCGMLHVCYEHKHTEKKAKKKEKIGKTLSAIVSNFPLHYGEFAHFLWH